MSQWGLTSLSGWSANVPLLVGGLGFGLALAPVNAAVLASTDGEVHGLASRRRRRRPDGRDAGRHLGADHDRAAPLLRRDARRARRRAGLRRRRAGATPSTTCCARPASPRSTRSSPGPPSARWSRPCWRWCCSGAPAPGRYPPVRGRLRRPDRRQRAYAESFADGGFDGVAHAGVAVVTCMDSRIVPLRDARAAATATPRSSATPAAGSRRRPSRRWCSASTCSASTGSWWSPTPAARWPPPPRRSCTAGLRVGRHRRQLAAVPRRRRPARGAARRRPPGPRPPADPRAGQGRRLPLRRRHRAAHPARLRRRYRRVVHDPTRSRHGWRDGARPRHHPTSRRRRTHRHHRRTTPVRARRRRGRARPVRHDVRRRRHRPRRGRRPRPKPCPARSTSWSTTPVGPPRAPATRWRPSRTTGSPTTASTSCRPSSSPRRSCRGSPGPAAGSSRCPRWPRCAALARTARRRAPSTSGSPTWPAVSQPTGSRRTPSRPASSRRPASGTAGGRRRSWRADWHASRWAARGPRTRSPPWCAHLASPEAGFTTGQVIGIHGGTVLARL